MRHLRAFYSTLILACSAGSPDLAVAAWSTNPNLNNEVVTASGAQGSAAVLEDGAGGFFVAWTDTRSISIDIYAQRIDAQGNRLWTSSGVPVCIDPNDQFLPLLAPDGAGGVIIGWSDLRTGFFSGRAQRLDGSGVPLWTANGVVVIEVPGDQIIRGVVSDGAGGAIFALDDTRGDPGDIYTQRLDPGGTAVWSSGGEPMCQAAGRQDRVEVVPDGFGGAILAWEDLRGANGDIYAQRVDAAGNPLWATDGEPVVTAASSQNELVAASDGNAGAFLAWHDFRGGAIAQLFVHRIDFDGQPLWPVDGVPASLSGSSANSPDIVHDGTGGCIVAWEDLRNGIDFDQYAQRFSAGGAELWTPVGLLVSGAPDDQYAAAVLADGTGGAIISWYDLRGGGFSVSDIYAQRVSASGSILWQANGTPVCQAARDQFFPAIASDATGGALLAWIDRRNPDEDIYAQRIERFGQLGAPEPVVSSVTDVPNDEGGQVRVSWNASYLDVVPEGAVDEYRLWREVPPAAAHAALRNGARLISPGESYGERERVIRSGRFAAHTIFWELAGTQPANGFSGYSMVAATTGDSVGGSNPLTRFMVEARQGSTGYYWESAPDSGYSVDNLAPPAPEPFSGVYTSGSSSLEWGASAAPDVAHYRLYRGSSSGFTPGPSSLVATITGTEYVDTPGGPFWYKVTGVDTHGNEGPPATTLPSGTVGVEDRLPATVWLGPATPNPTRAGATFRFALPRAADVQIAVFDHQGRRVRSLASGVFEPGHHELRWDGRSQLGAPVRSGLYLYRIDADGVRRTGRVAVIR